MSVTSSSRKVTVDCVYGPTTCKMAEHLRAILLTAGSVDRSALRTAAGRLPAELPIDGKRTALDLWHDFFANFARQRKMDDLHVRLLIDQDVPTAPTVESQTPIRFTVERDPQPFRGTAGLIRDVVDAYGDEDFVLVVNAAQIPLADPEQMFCGLCQAGGDVTVASNRDGTPSGLMLLRCAAMRSISRTGFVDMKEQGLKQIARKHRVTVARFDHPPALPLRSRARYVAGLRAFHRARAGMNPFEHPLEERWQRMFGIREDGAHVASSAVLHDSVVLDGGRVEADAVVIRSVVCGGAVVRRNQTVIDQLLASPARAKEAAEVAQHDVPHS